MIPHHFHLIWIGRNFPFVNRLAIESILQTNPGARITVHFEDPPDNADWRALQSKAEFRPISLSDLLKAAPGDLGPIGSVLAGIASGYPAGRSNILRYLILYAEGGIYIDFDTLTVRDYRPLLAHPAFLGEEAVFRYDDDRVAGRFPPALIPTGVAFGASYYLSLANCRWLGDSAFGNAVNRGLMRLWSDRKLNNAVLGCEPGNPFFAKALSLVPGTDPKIRYSLGPILMNRTWATEAAAHARRLGENHFYCIPPSQTYRFFLGPAPALPSEAYSVHWCSSNHKKRAAALSRANLERPASVPALFPKLAFQVLEKGI